MFDNLSGKLQNVFRNLRGLGKISEDNVSDSLREVRLALLEADVNFKVARDFIERVKTKAIGAEVIQSVQPGQPSSAPSVFDAQLTSDASQELGDSVLHWQRATQEEQVPGLHRFDVSTERG